MNTQIRRVEQTTDITGEALRLALLRIGNQEFQSPVSLNYEDVAKILLEAKVPKRDRDFLHGKLQFAKSLSGLEARIENEIGAVVESGSYSYNNLIYFLNSSLKYDGSSSAYETLKNTGLIKYSSIKDVKHRDVALRQQAVNFENYRLLNKELITLKSKLKKLEQDLDKRGITYGDYTYEYKRSIAYLLKKFRGMIQQNQFYKSEGEGISNYLARIDLGWEHNKSIKYGVKRKVGHTKRDNGDSDTHYKGIRETLQLRTSNDRQEVTETPQQDSSYISGNGRKPNTGFGKYVKGYFSFHKSKNPTEPTTALQNHRVDHISNSTPHSGHDTIDGDINRIASALRERGYKMGYERESLRGKIGNWLKGGRQGIGSFMQKSRNYYEQYTSKGSQETQKDKVGHISDHIGSYMPSALTIRRAAAGFFAVISLATLIHSANPVYNHTRTQNPQNVGYKQEFNSQKKGLPQYAVNQTAQNGDNVPQDKNYETVPQAESSSNKLYSFEFTKFQLEELAKIGWTPAGYGQFRYILTEKGYGISQALVESDRRIGKDRVMSAKQSARAACIIAGTPDSEVINRGNCSYDSLRDPRQNRVIVGSTIYAPREVVAEFLR